MHVKYSCFTVVILKKFHNDNWKTHSRFHATVTIFNPTGFDIPVFISTTRYTQRAL